MRYFWIPLFLIVWSCSNQKEIEIIQNSYNTRLKNIERIIEAARMLADDEPELNSEVMVRVNKLDSALKQAIKLIDARNEDEAVNSIVQLGKELFPDYEMSTHELPSNQRNEYAMLELTTLTENLVNKLGSEVGANDMKLDQFKIFIEPNKTSVRLGETINGKVYFALYSSSKEYLFFMMNGDTLVNQNGVAEFSFTPNKRGIQKLKFEVIPNLNARWLEQIEKEKTIEIETK